MRLKVFFPNGTSTDFTGESIIYEILIDGMLRVLAAGSHVGTFPAGGWAGLRYMQTPGPAMEPIYGTTGWEHQ